MLEGTQHLWEPTLIRDQDQSERSLVEEGRQWGESVKTPRALSPSSPSCRLELLLSTSLLFKAWRVFSLVFITEIISLSKPEGFGRLNVKTMLFTVLQPNSSSHSGRKLLTFLVWKWGRRWVLEWGQQQIKSVGCPPFNLGGDIGQNSSDQILFLGAGKVLLSLFYWRCNWTQG